ncbi:Fc.00g075760.m01.CDS01 [Cosmosporella sp. VM-42]
MPSPSSNDVEPFPPLESTPPADEPSPRSEDPPPPGTNRPAASSSLSGRLRRVSQSFEQSELPEGFMAATGGIASSILSRQAPRTRAPSTGSSSTQQGLSTDPPARQRAFPPVSEEVPRDEKDGRSSASAMTSNLASAPLAAAPFPNGYHFPPKHSFAQSTSLGLLAFWRYFLTPVGFLVTIYGLNVVAWGGMLFLLLCNASPAMCHPTCNDINSPRRKWIEWDSQILNALFCVTGFGLAPWRFRDLYFLLQYRVQKKDIALRKLAGIHRGWFRLAGSPELPIELGPATVADYSSTNSTSAIPYPENKISDVPLTGIRAPATRLWKLDAVIWLMVWNTILQCCLAGFMWALNRYDRPSWSTGLFVGLASAVAIWGGLIMFFEGKKVKSIEGVPLSEEDRQRLEADRERGIWHYNNIKDKELGPDGKKVKK